MSAVGLLAAAAALFVGTHFLLSHPLRMGLVSRIGTAKFLILYSVVALLTLVWMIRAYGPAMRQAPGLCWEVGDLHVVIATLLMWFGSILFAGSFVRNPAFPSGHVSLADIGDPVGVFAITRHPMNWGFALWAVVHALVNPTLPSLIVSGAIFILAIGGSVAQDHKKHRILGNVWRHWEAKTSFFPFARTVALPDMLAVIAGTLLFLIATWAHGALGYRPAGVWAFFA